MGRPDAGRVVKACKSADVRRLAVSFGDRGTNCAPGVALAWPLMFSWSSATGTSAPLGACFSEAAGSGGWAKGWRDSGSWKTGMSG